MTAPVPPFAGLERLLRPKPVARPGERCEMCGEPVPDEHSHVADLENRGVLCACRSCYLLFTHSGAGRGKYRAIPERYRYDPAPRITDMQWDELQIPVRMAFFFENSALGRYVCFYPSPAGATESLLPIDTFAGVLADNPGFADSEPDVEALLVQRRDGAFELFGVPIDACYELVGLVKRRWKGFDGGQEVWRDVAAFFDRLRERSTVIGGALMVELVFDCLGGAPERYAASPMLTFRLRIAEVTGARLHSIALRCQIRIQPQQRRYSTGEAERLRDLFGDTPRWGETLHPMQFATVAMHVPGFAGSTEVDLQVPCTYDLEVAAGRYFDALTDGEIPMLMLFSGTVFYRDADGGLAVAQVPWHKDTTYRLPVSAWRELIDLYFPNSGWIRLPRDTVAALCRFKSQQAVAGWDEAIGMLLERAGEGRP